MSLLQCERCSRDRRLCGFCRFVSSEHLAYQGFYHAWPLVFWGQLMLSWPAAFRKPGIDVDWCQQALARAPRDYTLPDMQIWSRLVHDDIPQAPILPRMCDEALW